MLCDNHAEYQRKMTRGAPREGAALLQGIVWCGQCGRKMTVQYRGRNGYNCRSLHHEHGAPVCQQLPADPIDAEVVAFFAAVTPASSRPGGTPTMLGARRTRPLMPPRPSRSSACATRRLAERQFTKVDPDNRNVAGELEHRWELALRELREAEEALSRHRAERATPERCRPRIGKASSRLARRPSGNSLT